MKKIAILSSGNGDSALEAAGLFNEGNRVRIPLYVTNVEIDQSTIEKLKGENIEIIGIAAEGSPETGNSLADRLKLEGIDLIVIDNFNGIIPEEVLTVFADRIVSIAEGETIQRAVVRNLITGERKTPEAISSPESGAEGIVDVEIADKADLSDAEFVVSEEVTDENVVATNKPKDDEPESADEAWSKVLHLEFDKEKVAQGAVPPPITAASHNVDNNNRYAQPGNNQQSGYTPGGVPPMSQSAYPNNNPQFNPNRPDAVKMPPSYLIWSVLATVFCCFIPGIVGIVFSSQVSSRYFRGDYAGAEKASRNAQIWIIVSFVLGMISSTLYFPLMMIQ